MKVAGISYTEAGIGPAVVCLHGIGGGRDSFLPQLSAIHDHRVISWDMPGYGDSDITEHSFVALSAKLREFITALDLDHVVLMGQSIGGMLAIEHALRCPKQVKGLVLMATTPSFGGRDDSFKEQFLTARLAALEAGKTMAEMAADNAPDLVGKTADAELIAQIARIFSAVPETTWRSILPCLTSFNRRDDLGKITCPAMVICGENDTSAPARTMQWMADHLGNASFHLIKSAGHMVNQEMPREVNTLINDYLVRNVK